MDVKCIANEYGNVDVRGGKVPKGYAHIAGKRLQSLCRTLRIPYVRALVDWGGTKKWPKPIMDGVVVTTRSAHRLRKAIAERTARARPPLTDEQRAAARERREARDAAIFAAAIRERLPRIPAGEADSIASHACVIGSGRVGRCRSAEDPVMAAVVAYVRHRYTEYDEMIDGARAFASSFEEMQDVRQDAREAVGSEIAAKIREWEPLQTL